MSSLFSYFKPTEKNVAKKEPSTPVSRKRKNTPSSSLNRTPNGDRMTSTRVGVATPKRPQTKGDDAGGMNQMRRPVTLPTKRGISEDDDSEGEIGVRKVRRVGVRVSKSVQEDCLIK